MLDFRGCKWKKKESVATILQSDKCRAELRPNPNPQCSPCPYEKPILPLPRHIKSSALFLYDHLAKNHHYLTWLLLSQRKGHRAIVFCFFCRMVCAYPSCLKVKCTIWNEVILRHIFPQHWMLNHNSPWEAKLDIIQLYSTLDQKNR